MSGGECTETTSGVVGCPAAFNLRVFGLGVVIAISNRICEIFRGPLQCKCRVLRCKHERLLAFLIVKVPDGIAMQVFHSKGSLLGQTISLALIWTKTN